MAAVAGAVVPVVVAVTREARALARELRPAPHRRSRVVRLVGWVVRHLPEILAVLVAVEAWQGLSGLVGAARAAVLLGVLAAAVVVWSRSRRWLLAGLGCVVTRYRLRAALVELRLSTRTGRLPVVVALWPTAVGERVWLCCPAGVSAEDLADETDHLRAACWARQVRVNRNQRYSAFVAVDVIRRDPLASASVVASPLAKEADGG